MDYTKMNASQLKEECKKLGIKGTYKRKEMIEKLENYNKGKRQNDSDIRDVNNNDSDVMNVNNSDSDVMNVNNNDCKNEILKSQKGDDLLTRYDKMTESEKIEFRKQKYGCISMLENQNLKIERQKKYSSGVEKTPSDAISERRRKYGNFETKINPDLKSERQKKFQVPKSNN